MQKFILTINDDGSIKMEPYVAPTPTATPVTTPVTPTPTPTTTPVIVAPAPTHMNIGTNLEELADWMTDKPFLNLAVTARAWHSGTAALFDDGGKVQTIDGYISALNANQIAYKVISTSDRTPGLYNVVFQCATTEVSKVQPLVSGLTFVSQIPQINGTTLLNYTTTIPQTGNVFIKIGQSTTPVTFTAGLKLIAFQMGTPDTSLNTPTLNPEFVKQINRYAGIRLMDWQQTNKAKAARVLTAVSPSQISAIANQLTLNKLWVCVPHEDTISSTHPLLSTAFKATEILIENSNEVWNSMFPVNAYATANSPLATGTAFDKAMAWHAKRTAQLSIATTGPNKKIVLGAWNNVPFWTGELLKQVKAAGGTRVDYVAVAPYFGHGLDDATEVELMRLAKEAVDFLPQHQAAIATSPFPQAKLALYEFGSHLIPGVAANKDEKMFRVYQYFLAELEKVLGATGTAFHFTKTGTYGPSGSWGESDKFGDETTPKARALALYKK